MSQITTENRGYKQALNIFMEKIEYISTNQSAKLKIHVHLLLLKMHELTIPCQSVRNNTINLQQRMLPTKISICSTNKSKYWQQRFLIDPHADLFLSHATRIFPLHRTQLLPSRYFSYDCSLDTKFHALEEPLDSSMLEKVLAYLYGFDIELTHYADLSHFVDVVDFLKIEQLRQNIETKLPEYLPSLDIFPILEMAYQFHLSDTFNLCLQYLECQEFEQVNYNRFDFLRSHFTLFQLVLRRHHSLKINGKIYGLSPETIEEVIRSYCTRHNFNHETLTKLLEKYVKSLKSHYLKKCSLRLGKLGFKEVFQSGTYENELADKPNLKSEAGPQETVKPKEKGRDRKMSCNVEDRSKNQLRWFGFGYDTLHKHHQAEEKDRQMIPQQKYDPKDESEGQVNFSMSMQKKKTKNSNGSEQDADSIGEFQGQEEGGDDSFLGKVSTLLDQYTEAYNEHQTNFDAIKNNVKQSAKSLIFRQSEGIENLPSQFQKTTARFTNSTKFVPFGGIL